MSTKSYTHGDLETALLASHDKSMSKDEMTACEGRAAKVMINLVSTWREDELNHRKTDNVVVTLAGVSLGISLITTTFATVAGDEELGAQIMKRLRKHIIERYDTCIANLEKIAAEQQKETA